MVHRDKQSIGRWERGEIDIDSAAEALIRRLAIEKLDLPTKMGIDELSRRSFPTAEPQLISIANVEKANNGGISSHESYKLVAA